MTKRYRVKSLMKERSGYPCYVVRTEAANEEVLHKWARGEEPPSELPAREAMHSLMQLKRGSSTYEWELEAVDD